MLIHFQKPSNIDNFDNGLSVKKCYYFRVPSRERQTQRESERAINFVRDPY